MRVVPPVVTLAVMLWGISGSSYWRDESATLAAVHRPFTQLIRMLGHVDAVHGAYYVVMWPLVRVAGSSQLVTRLPSAVAMAVAAGLVAALGRRLVSPATGLAAGLVFAVLPAVSLYGQDASSYAMVTASAAGASYLLLRLITAPGGRRGWRPVTGVPGRRRRAELLRAAADRRARGDRRVSLPTRSRRAGAQVAGAGLAGGRGRGGGGDQPRRAAVLDRAQPAGLAEPARISPSRAWSSWSARVRCRSAWPSSWPRRGGKRAERAGRDAAGLAADAARARRALAGGAADAAARGVAGHPAVHVQVRVVLRAGRGAAWRGGTGRGRPGDGHRFGRAPAGAVPGAGRLRRAGLGWAAGYGASARWSRRSRARRAAQRTCGGRSPGRYPRARTRSSPRTCGPGTPSSTTRQPMRTCAAYPYGMDRLSTSRSPSRRSRPGRSSGTSPATAAVRQRIAGVSRLWVIEVHHPRRLPVLQGLGLRQVRVWHTG